MIRTLLLSVLLAIPAAAQRLHNLELVDNVYYDVTVVEGRIALTAVSLGSPLLHFVQSGPGAYRIRLIPKYGIALDPNPCSVGSLVHLSLSDSSWPQFRITGEISANTCSNVPIQIWDTWDEYLYASYCEHQGCTNNCLPLVRRPQAYGFSFWLERYWF